MNKSNLIAIEEQLRKLWSPQWPADLPPINEGLRVQGEVLFKANCQSCHAPIQRDAEDRRVTADMRAVGTDQAMAANFATRKSKTGVLAGRRFSLTGFRTFGPVEPTKDVLVHMVERVLVRPTQPALFAFVPDELLSRFQFDLGYPIFAEIKLNDQKVMGHFTALQMEGNRVKQVLSRDPLRLLKSNKLFRQDISLAEEVGRLVSPDGSSVRLDELPDTTVATTGAGTRLTFAQPASIQFAYKGRPLNGIWATAPYLHNGSVPNLDELLKPPAGRVKKFRVGSREFDPATVGLKSDVGEFEFDTSLPGNSNAGHEYDREFTDPERLQLIEYLKSL